MLERVTKLTNRIQIFMFERLFHVETKLSPKEKRVYIQIKFWSRCSKTGQGEIWKSRKWYLSEYMTDDEIVKTCYAAFKMAVEHEVMESFKVDGITLFNPHLDFEELLKISHKEVTRG